LYIAAAPPSYLVNRDFTAIAPSRVWTADITYVPTGEGRLYLAVVLDMFSQRIAGWAMAGHPRTGLVLDALEMAIWNRRPAAGLIHQSDQGAAIYVAVVPSRLQQKHNNGAAPHRSHETVSKQRR
jgi:putative transposase